MKALLVSAFAVTALVSTVEARPAPRVAMASHPALAPLEEAATNCFVETVMANPKAVGLAKAGQWYEAAGVIGFLCRPEVARMVAGHDSLRGAGSGDRFFKREYAKHLERQLAERLQPLLDTKTVASAEPPIEKAGLGDATDLGKGEPAH